MRPENEWVLEEVKRLDLEEMAEVMIACGALLSLFEWEIPQTAGNLEGGPAR